MSTTLGPMFSRTDTEITGSIAPRDGRFATAMSDEDWAAARLAVDKATVDPSSSTTASWENPQTGLRGSVTPVASAFAADDRTCRAFVATLVSITETNWYQGKACRDAAGLAVGEVSPFVPPRP